MPDRRHLWRGIHDREMVAAALQIESDPPKQEAGMVTAGLTLANTGAGHYVPTYVTPRIVVSIAQTTRDGAVIAETTVTDYIGRGVPVDLSDEWYDTRIAPDARHHADYVRPRHPRAAGLRYRVLVEPDEFYARFYRALLADPDLRDGRSALEQALRAAEASPFVLFEADNALP